LVKELSFELQAANPQPKRKAWPLHSGFIAVWDCGVLDDNATLYLRLLSWAKLVRVWAGLRSADAAAAPAKRLTYDGQALRGDLLMTKTSGPGKRTPVLKFVVDSEAWLYHSNWLAVGWKLYDEVREDWDCLLPLPTKSEDALSEITPSYVQSCVASRKLMADMVYPRHLLGSPGRVLLPGVQAYWSEHSDRATLATFASLLGVPKEHRDMIGRWLPGKEGGADEYARGQAQIVRGIQRRVARAIRRESEEVVDEEGLIADLGVRMLESYTVEEAVRQADSLRRLQLPWPRPEDDHEVPAGSALMEEHADEDDLMDDAPPPLPLTPPEVFADEEENLEVVVPEAQVGFGQFVVSGVAGRRKTLHKKGRCWRIPGIHFVNFEVLTEEDLQMRDNVYSYLCKQCFPSGDLKDGDVLSSSDDEEVE